MIDLSDGINVLEILENVHSVTPIEYGNTEFIKYEKPPSWEKECLTLVFNMTYPERLNKDLILKMEKAAGYKLFFSYVSSQVYIYINDEFKVKN